MHDGCAGTVCLWELKPLLINFREIKSCETCRFRYKESYNLHRELWKNLSSASNAQCVNFLIENQTASGTFLSSILQAVVEATPAKRIAAKHGRRRGWFSHWHRLIPPVFIALLYSCSSTNTLSHSMNSHFYCCFSRR